MPTLTTNFQYSKPLVNNAVDADLWGGILNTNWDDLDANSSLTTSSKTSDFSVTSEDFNKTFLIDAASNTVDATLPSTIPFNGFTVRFKAVDVTEVITIDGNGNTIDGSATVTIDTNDFVIILISDGTNWRIISTPVASTTKSGAVKLATSAEVISQTANVVPTADNLRSHKGIAKALAKFSGTATSPITADYSYGISSIVRNSTGSFTVTFSDNFNSSDYVVQLTTEAVLRGNIFIVLQTADTITFKCTDDSAATLQNPVSVHLVAYGDLA